MVNEAAIAAAIADSKTQTVPNYKATTQLYEINRETLRKRFLSECVSRIKICFESQGHLNLTQKRVLVERVNMFSLQGLPPTLAIVWNFIAELCENVVGGHWVIKFIERHKNELTSVYLESIDYRELHADASHHPDTGHLFVQLPPEFSFFEDA